MLPKNEKARISPGLDLCDTAFYYNNAFKESA